MALLACSFPKPARPATRARVQRRFPSAREAPPSPEIGQAIDGITALLRGEARDLTGVTIDNAGVPEFNARVYAIARTHSAGRDHDLRRDRGTAGRQGAGARGRAGAGQNPTPIIMPCHRVLAAGGKTGGFSAPGGMVTKLRLLTIEGAQPGGPTLFDRFAVASAPPPPLAARAADS